MKDILKIPQETDLRMTSLQIAEILGKRHDNVIRDVRKICEEFGSSDLSHENYPRFETKMRKVRGKEEPFYSLNFEASVMLVAKYDNRALASIVGEWSTLKRAFHDRTWVHNDKEVQKRVMRTIDESLEEAIVLDYIKANTIVNKAVSNLYGFDRLVKKADMSRPMLDHRQEILEDLERLFEVNQDYGWVKETLYAKYQPKLLGD